MVFTLFKFYKRYQIVQSITSFEMSNGKSFPSEKLKQAPFEYPTESGFFKFI